MTGFKLVVILLFGRGREAEQLWRHNGVHLAQHLSLISEAISPFRGADCPFALEAELTVIKLFDGITSIGRSCIRTINPLASSLKITSVECMLTVVPSGLNANRWCTLMSISEIVLLEGEEAVNVDGSADVEGVVVIEGGFGFWTAVSETGLTAMISWEMVSDFVVTKGKPKNCPAGKKAFVRTSSEKKVTLVLTNFNSILRCREQILIHRILAQPLLDLGPCSLCLEQVKHETDVVLLCGRQLDSWCIAERGWLVCEGC